MNLDLDELFPSPADVALGPPPWIPGGLRGNSARGFWRHLAATVEALAARYPRALRNLDAEWWNEPWVAERLGALASLRREIDTAGPRADPYRELVFHHELDRTRDILDARAAALLTGRPDHPQAPVGTLEVERAAAERAAALMDALVAIPEGVDVDAEEAFLAPREGRPVVGSWQGER